MVKIFQNPLFDVIKEYIAAATNDDIIYIFTPYIKTSVLNEILSPTSAQIIIITSKWLKFFKIHLFDVIPNESGQMLVKEFAFKTDVLHYME